MRVVDDLKDISILISNPITWLVLAWIAREFWMSFKRSELESHLDAKSFKDDVAGALKENSGRLVSLTIALTKFESKLEGLESVVLLVPKLAQDVSLLFEKLKALEEKAFALRKPYIDQ